MRPCRCPRSLPVTVGLFALLAAAVADAHPRAAGGLAGAGARTVRARLDGVRADALEAGLPRQGAYGRAMRLDAEGRHVEALRAYGEALVELSGLATSLSAPPERRLAWRAKILWQREQSEELIEQEAYAAVMPTSIVAHLNLAGAAHAKYLSVRAFLGRGPEPLRERARAGYLAALELDGRHAGARLGLARLLADAGLVDEARREFAMLGRRRESDHLALQVAAFHLALGDDDLALAYLERSMHRPESRRWARTSNDFDRLRSDPRFEQLVGAPWRLALTPSTPAGH